MSVTQHDRHKPLFIRGGTLLDGRGSAPVQGAGVLIEAGRVKAVGRADEFGLPENTESLDATGSTIMPGLIDVHSHLMFAMHGSGYEIDAAVSIERATINALLNASVVLRMGFTTIRDLGSRGLSLFAVRDAVNAGQIEGPRIQASGRMLTTTGGLTDFHPSYTGMEPSIGYRADGPDEVRKAVRQLIKDGADCIKLEASAHATTRAGGAAATTMTEEELRVAVEEAHKQGKRVAAHAQGSDAIKNALRAGVDTIEHATFLDDEGLDLFLQTGAWLVPTLSNIYSYTELGAKQGWAPRIIEEMRALEKPWIDSFRRAVEAGVKIAMGSDVGNRYRQEERAVEMEMLVRNGLSPMECIVAATKNAAEAMGLEDQVGTIEPGKLADLVIVQGDPLADIEILLQRDCLTVLKDGQRIVDSNG